MKNVISLVLIGMMSATVALADGSSPKEGKYHPCEKILEACKAGGFVKGGHKDKKGLYMDCLKPILAGQSVSGVSVDSKDVQACQERKEKRKERREEKKENSSKSSN